jgi:ATP-dependent DNA helicase RecG
MEDTMQTSPDWLRLQKALAVEAERGFSDLVGKQYRFSEFLSLSFGKPPAALPPVERRRWQEMATQFASYPQLDLEERQHLVAEARRYLYQLYKETEGSGGQGSGGRRSK